MQHDILSPTVAPTVAATGAGATAFAITAASDGRIIDANDRFLRLFGLERDFALGHTFDDLHLFGPSSRRRHDGATGTAAPPRRIRVRVPGADFREIHITTAPLQLAGEPSVLTLFEDVTEYRRTERVLRETLERFRCTFDHAWTGMAVISTDAMILKANPAFCRMLGRAEEELLHASIACFSRPGDRELDGEDLRRLLARETENVQIEKQLLHADGRVVGVIMNLALVWSEFGDPRYFVCQVIERGTAGVCGVVVAESETAALPAIVTVVQE